MIEFHVDGEPAPAGSKSAFPLPGGGVSVADKAKGGAEWSAKVALAAAQAMDGRELLDGPLRLTLRFERVRTAAHFGTGRNEGKLKASAPEYPSTRPDLLKLARRVEDALAGVVYVEDSRICEETLSKVWGARARCYVCVESLNGLDLSPEF